MYCPNCKNPISTGAKFCTICGSPIKMMGIDGSARMEETSPNFLTAVRKSAANTVYDRMKPYIVPKDGKVHVLMINSFSKWLNQNFECEYKYTTQLNTIISSLQDDGYEIVDIKFNSIKNQGLMGEMEGFHTLIMYK